MQISIIGTGYVGLVTGTCLAELGNHVTCMDSDAGKISRLSEGIPDISEPGLPAMLSNNLRGGRLRFTPDLKDAARGEVIMLATGTPRGAGGSADTTAVNQVATQLAHELRGKEAILAIKSTVPVGTCEALQAQFRAEDGGRAGVAVISLPEFLREGSAIRDFLNPDRIVVGTSSPSASEKIRVLFAPLQAPFVEMSTRSAELTKLAANSYLAMRISYANTVDNVCQALGVSTGEVLAGLGLDRRIGSKYLQPGLGYGGPCLPKDVDALISIAAEHGLDVQLMRVVQEVNRRQVVNFVERVKKACGGNVRGATICVLGLTFKAGTNDLRGSLPLEVVRRLTSSGATVQAYDPAIPLSRSQEIPARLFESSYIAAEGASAVIALTAWPEFARLDYARLARAVTRRVWIEPQRIADPAGLNSAGFTAG